MEEVLRDRYARVDDVELHWAELGKPGGRTPLVLIHGLTDSHLSWRKVAPDLARDRLLLMPDLPGCGLSGRPDASYGLEWQAQLLARWMKQLGLSSVDVVGHSYGGGVAQMLLLACPERIRRLVLAASGGLGRDVGFWLKLGAFPYFVERHGQRFMAFGTKRALGNLMNRSGEGPSTDDARDIEALSKMNAKPGSARAFSRTVRDVIDFGGQTRHFLQRAHEIEVFPPILVLWGEQDTLIPMKHGQDFVAALNGAVFQSFAGCGHYLHRERPAEVVRALRAFLDAEDATPVSLSAAPAR
jgi:pimeloyl-ACP methyl ester carboxylesterase